MSKVQIDIVATNKTSAAVAGANRSLSTLKSRDVVISVKSSGAAQAKSAISEIVGKTVTVDVKAEGAALAKSAVEDIPSQKAVSIDVSGAGALSLAKSAVDDIPSQKAISIDVTSNIGDIQQQLNALQSGSINIGSMGGGGGGGGGSMGSMLPSTLTRFAGGGGMGMGALGIAGGVAAVGAGLVAGTMSVINKYADLEQGITNLVTILDADTATRRQLEAKAQEIGSGDTPYSSTDVAGAMEMLARNGLNAAEVLGTVESAAFLASATTVGSQTAVENFPIAADIATDALVQFGLDVKDMPEVADLIAGFVNTSKGDLRDFAYFLARAGGVAGQAVGMDFSEFVSTGAAMMPFFASGQDMGTAMNTFMLRMNNLPKSSLEDLNALGLLQKDSIEWDIKTKKVAQKDAEGKTVKDEKGNTVYDIVETGRKIDSARTMFADQEGNMRSMSEIAEILRTATADLDQDEILKFLGKTFGQDAIRMGIGLMGAGSEGLLAQQEKVEKVEVERMAKQKQDTLKGEQSAMGGKIETLAALVGEDPAEVLRSMVKSGNLSLDEAIGYFNALGEKQQQLEKNRDEFETASMEDQESMIEAGYSSTGHYGATGAGSGLTDAAMTTFGGIGVREAARGEQMIREGEAQGGAFGAAKIGYGTVVMTVGEAFIDTATAVVTWDASAATTARRDRRDELHNAAVGEGDLENPAWMSLGYDQEAGTDRRNAANAEKRAAQFARDEAARQEGEDPIVIPASLDTASIQQQLDGSNFVVSVSPVVSGTPQVSGSTARRERREQTQPSGAQSSSQTQARTVTQNNQDENPNVLEQVGNFFSGIFD